MKSTIQYLLLCLISFSLAGQDNDLLGIVDDQLIKINSSTNAIEVIGNLNPAPAELVRFLTYVEEDCLIYGLLNSSLVPTLISIDMDLNFTIIGVLTMPGNSIYFCESLAFNDTDNTLYTSASINGNNSSGDYYSESILEVNRFSAGCQFKTEITGNVDKPDVDRMTFCDNILYYQDAQPEQWSKFFELDYMSLGPISQGDELTTIGFVPLRDLECLYGNVYYSVGRDLFVFNTSSYNVTNLGNLFSPSDFGGEVITGLSINPFPDYLDLEDDVILCNEDDYLIELDYSYQNVTWNNGSTGSSILVFDSGQYWADVIYNNCTFRTDTIDVTFMFPLDIPLISDTILCDGESIFLIIDEPDIEIEWSDGSTDNVLEVSDPGVYWAQYTKDGCTFFTDSVNVAVGDYNLGEDIRLCEGESYVLNIEGVGQNISWNNGYTGNNLIVAESGLYWAVVMISDCTFYSDTINVEVVENQLSIGEDISLCEGENYVVTLEGVGQNINWNNGYTGNQLIITEPGTYWADIIFEDCAYRTDSFDVFIIEQVQHNIQTDTVICSGEIIYYTISEPDVNVIWSDGTVNNEIAISDEGYYWAQYMKEGCTFFTDTIFVDVVDGEFDIGSDVNICDGESYILDLDGVGENVVWNTGYVGSQLEINQAGEYWAEIILNDCEFETNTINVSIIPIQTIGIGADTVLCGEEEIILGVLNASLEYQWSTGEVANSIVVKEDGIYWASVMDGECPSKSDSIEVRFIEDPNVIYDIDTLLCLEEQLDLPNSVYDITWKNNASENLTSITEPGSYWGTYQIDHCTFETDALKVEFADCTPCEYYIPNVISPNSDGVNDGLEVIFTKVCNILDFEIFIFDRWGNLVRKSKDNFWDGKLNPT